MYVRPLKFEPEVGLFGLARESALRNGLSLSVNPYNGSRSAVGVASWTERQEFVIGTKENSSGGLLGGGSWRSPWLSTPNPDPPPSAPPLRRHQLGLTTNPGFGALLPAQSDVLAANLELLTVEIEHLLEVLPMGVLGLIDGASLLEDLAPIARDAHDEAAEGEMPAARAASRHLAGW